MSLGPWTNEQTAENEETDMKVWKRPVIQEIRVGMEINLYFPAEL